MKKTAIITIIGILTQGLMSAACFAESNQMLSPALQLELNGFQQGLIELTSQPAVAADSSIIDVVRELRGIYPLLSIDKTSPSAWAEIFLEIGLLRSTKPLRNQIQRYIHWIKTDEYKTIDALEKLAYIRRLAENLTPFEKILFYEGVYYSPDNTDLGFGITASYYKTAGNYYYGDELFAHGSYQFSGKSLELAFGDDLTGQNKAHIPEVHYYAFMKKLMHDIIQIKPDKLVITNAQLTDLANWYDQSFLPKSLNFYLIKVGGFVAEYNPEGYFNQAIQQEFMAQMQNGMHIRYTDALAVSSMHGLVRDIGQEEKEYWEQATTKPIEKKPLEINIKSHDLLSFADQEIFKMNYLDDHPVKVTDKVVVEELGYCAGMIIASGNSLWLRRYSDKPNIMDALEADINASNSEELFNKNTKIVFLSTSYGAWRWNFEQVQEELIKKGVPAENIVMPSWDDQPEIDRVGIYLFPTGQVVVHKKNINIGVAKILTYQNHLANYQSPDILDRDQVEEMLGLVSTRNLSNKAISANPAFEKMLSSFSLDQSI